MFSRHQLNKRMQLLCIKELKASFIWGVLNFFSPKCNLTKADPEILFPTLGPTHSKCYPPEPSSGSSWYWLKASQKLELRAKYNWASRPPPGYVAFWWTQEFPLIRRRTSGRPEGVRLPTRLLALSSPSTSGTLKVRLWKESIHREVAELAFWSFPDMLMANWNLFG